MKTRMAFWILATLFIVACSNKKEQNEAYLEINNKVLEKEIIEYDKFIDSTFSDPYVIKVSCIEKNDSITRYVIGAIDGTDILEMFPYHFICKINNKDVFFTMYSGLVFGDKKHNFFKLKQNEIERIMKKYFPQEYSKYLINKEKKKKGEMYEVIMTTFEPNMYYLTFNRGKLINKEIRRGLPQY